MKNEQAEQKTITLGDTILFDNYMISKDGEIFSFISGRIMKLSKNKQGYLTVKLKISETESRTFNVHSLVFKTFKPELYDLVKRRYLVIDHIDDDKSNPRLDNLQAITHKDNIIKYHESKIK
jgi:hypothetical protein